MSIDTTSPELVWTYRARENAFLREHGAPPAPSELVVFASGQLPYLATPRFDVARWDYGNYSSVGLGPGSY